jgi:cyclopropane fatty-acyl-phospholipid synthase-like methyltransferase
VAARHRVRATGITLSPVQAAAGARRVAALSLSGRVTMLEGDFCDPPAGLAPADLAWAVEAFVHGASVDRFLAACARLVRPGGLLVLCDDFARSTPAPGVARFVERFRRGWQVNAFVDVATLRARAAVAGFEHVSTTDLTPWLELGRPRDRAIALLAPLLWHVPGAATRWGPLLGGSALQQCLARGWIAYELVVFRRR